MIDIDKWGAPPPITDNVNHGDLLKSLNALGFAIQKENADYTTTPALTLEQVRAKVAAFGVTTKALVEAHTTKTGISHGETKSTIGLSIKDNFRMATIEECQTLANVDAFVSPAGAKAALTGLATDLRDRFQQNDIFPIAVLSNQPLFKHTNVSSSIMSALLRGPGMIGRFKDTLLMSPRQSGNSNNVFSLYKGFTATAGVNNRFFDTGGVKYGLKGNPENPTVYEEIGASAANRVLVLETPNKGHTGATKVSVTSPDFTGNVMNGVVGSFTVAGLNKERSVFMETANPLYGGPKTHAYLWQYHYCVNSNGGVFARSVDRAFDGGSSGLFVGSSSGSNHKGISIASICKSNDPNVTLQFEDYFASTCWEVRDHTYIIKLQGIISHTNSITGKKLYVNFSFAIRATIAQSAATTATRVVYTPVYYFQPTVLVESNLNSFNSGYTRRFEKGSVLDTFAHPGSMIEDGLYVRQQTYPQHSYVHYTRFADVLTVVDYFKTPINALHGQWVNTIPVSHIGLAPWGNTAQRLIPFEYGDDGFKVLSYAMDNSNGGWTWSQLTWSDKTQAKPRASFKTPDKGERLDTSKVIPSSVTSFVTPVGVEFHGLNFVEANRYTGVNGLKYANGVFTNTGNVRLNPNTLSGLLSQETAFLTRAKAYYNNAAAEAQQEFTVGVFTLGKNGLTTKNQALVVLSDGLAYLEVAIAEYVIGSGIYTITTTLQDLKRYPVTPSVKPTVFTGVVEKADTYRILSTFSDMLVYEHATGETIISFNRPWGDHRIGKVTIHLTNYNTSALSMNVSSINVQPTKMVGNTTSLGAILTDAQWNDEYQTSYVAYPVVNSMPFETFDICTPELGFMCNKGTRPGQSRLGRHITINANKADGVGYDFDTIQQGDVILPSGYPVVLAGRAMKVYRDIGYNGINTGAAFHYYLKRDGLNLEIQGVNGAELEPRSDYIEIAKWDTAVGGIALTENELTISGLKMSYDRKGSSFPSSMFWDTTGVDLYGFFYYTDAPHFPPRFESDLPATKTLYATELGTFTVDIYSRIPPVVMDWYVKAPNNVVTKVGDKVATTLVSPNVYRATLNHAFAHWDLSGSIVYGEAFDSRPMSTLTSECNVTVTIPIFQFTLNNVATKTIAYNGSANYSVAVNAQAGVASYEWYQKVGATTTKVGVEPSLTLTNQTSAQNGSQVWCEVTDNEGNMITSVVCTLTVAMPYITTDLITPIYHYVSPNAKTFSVVIQPYAGVPEFTWWIIPYGTSTPIQIANGITSNGTSSTLQYVMDNVQDMVERVFCKVTFPADVPATLQSTTSVIYLSTPLEFSINLPATTTTTRPGVEKTFNVAVIGGTGNPTYSWYTQWTNPSGVESPATYAGGSPSLTFMLQGGVGSSWKVWVRVQDPRMGDMITSNQQVIRLSNPIEMIYPLQDWMWGNSNGPTTIFVAVKDENGPYTFDWTVEADLWKEVSSSRNASSINFGKENLNRDHVLRLRVTDASGNFKDFSTTITTTAFNGAGKFDPMPPKAIPVQQDVGGVPLTFQTAGTTAPLRFQYFDLDDGTNFAHDVDATYDTRTYFNQGNGERQRLVLEVGATDKGILPSNEFTLVSVDSLSSGYGLELPVLNGDKTQVQGGLNTAVGRFPKSIFLYYIDTSVAPQFRKAVEFGAGIGIPQAGGGVIATIPDAAKGKNIEVYSAAIDADGRWYVSGVVPMSIPGGIASWQTVHDGMTLGSSSSFTFTFNPDGTWGFAGNGTGNASGQWLGQLPGNGEDYSLRIVSTAPGSSYSSSNMSASFQKVNIGRYIKVQSVLPPVGEADNVRTWQGVIEIRDDITGTILTSGQMTVSAWSMR